MTLKKKINEIKIKKMKETIVLLEDSKKRSGCIPSEEIKKIG